MREILFRAKRVDNGAWVEGYYSELPIPSLGCMLKAGSDEYIACEDTSSYIIEIITKQHPYFSNSNPMQVFEFEKYEVIPETVGQYTGLTDKNGKKIFEGDIVRLQTFGEMTEKYQNQKEFDKHKKRLIKDCGCIFDTEIKYHTNYDYIVGWELNGFYPFCDSPENCGHCGGAEDNCKCEIIGNLHDNPELLEVEE